MANANADEQDDEPTETCCEICARWVDDAYLVDHLNDHVDDVNSFVVAIGPWGVGVQMFTRDYSGYTILGMAMALTKYFDFRSPFTSWAAYAPRTVTAMLDNYRQSLEAYRRSHTIDNLKTLQKAVDWIGELEVMGRFNGMPGVGHAYDAHRAMLMAKIKKYTDPRPAEE